MLNVEHRKIFVGHVEKEQYAGMSVAVHLHVFYVDLLPEFCKYLDNIPVGFDMYVSVPETIDVDEQNLRNVLSAIRNVNNIEIRKTPNRGRDIAPMICTFGESLSKYDVILHMHTKKSPHSSDVVEWRTHLLDHILFSEDYVENLLVMLRKDVGYICASDYFCDLPNSGWGENKEIAKGLLDKCNIDIDIDKDYPSVEFPMGSFFWARREALLPALSLNIDYNDFPPEPIGVDGSLAHAIERLLFVLADSTGYVNVKACFLVEEFVEKRRRTERKNLKHLRIMRYLIYLCAALVLAILLLIIK